MNPTENMLQNQNTNKEVIVTGAAGYIGGATCIALKAKGYTVIGIDRRPLPVHLSMYVDTFEKCCFTDFWSLMHVESKPLAIIHCAGTSLVGPSMKNPYEYYNNNVSKTLKYLNYIRNWSPDTKFIFSSSASVYGDPLSAVLFEKSDTAPISPYGESKLFTEKMLQSFNVAYGTRYVSFRYFNACGAVEKGIHGQEPNATHIFAKIFEAAMNDEPFTINGSNFNTRDGTCIRDYIHVSDIAEAHVLGIDTDIEGIYNIGSLKGYSNLEIFTAVNDFLVDNQFINKHIVCSFDAPREGDPATLIASAQKLEKDTGWKAKRNLNTIIEDLHNWYSSKNYDKLKQRPLNDIQPAL